MEVPKDAPTEAPMEAPNNANEVDLEEAIANQEYLEQCARERFPYDPSSCTLYMDIAPRQLLFACLTCSPTNALCYSCGLRCHSSHELVELYTKRDMRCDCGTMRFGPNGARCTLRPHIAGVSMDPSFNAEYRYNHNFESEFCTCREKTSDEGYGTSAMFQCVIGSRCGEDWFHARCIVGISREEEQMRQQQAADDSSSESGDDLETVYPELPAEFGALVCPECIKDATALLESPAFLTTVNGYAFLKEEYQNQITDESLLAKFPFLGHEEETYTPEKDTDPMGSLEAGLRALGELPHERVLDGIAQFNTLQSELVTYVSRIARERRVVTKEDIENFFAERQ